MNKHLILLSSVAIVVTSCCATSFGAKRHEFPMTKLSQWTVTNTGPTKLEIHMKNGALVLHWPGGPGKAVVESVGAAKVAPFVRHPPRHPDRGYVRYLSQVNILHRKYGSQFLVEIQPILKNGKQGRPYLMRRPSYGGTTGLGTNSRLYAPPGQWARVDFNYAPSRKVAAIKARYVLQGNEITASIKQASLAPGLVWKRGRPEAQPEPRKFDEKHVEAILAARPRDKPKLVREPGRVALMINGKNMFPACYTRGPNYPQYTRYGMFTKAGFNIFRIYASFGPMSRAHRRGIGNLWRGKNQFNWSELAHELKVITNINPQAHVIVCAIISPYRGWAKQHPNSIVTNAKGQKLVQAGGEEIHYGAKPDYTNNRESYYAPSFYGGQYPIDAANAVKHLAKFLQTSAAGKIVFEVDFGGGTDGQLYPWDRDRGRGGDFSPVGVKAWHQFLRRRYHNSIDQLRAAWHDGKVTFGNAQVPNTRQRGYGSSIVTPGGADYNDFISDAMATFELGLGKALKEGSQGRLLAGVYYSDGGREGIISHTEMDRIERSPYIDCIRSVAYPMMSGSWQRHDKLIWFELDMRPPMPNQMQYYTRGLYYPKSYFHTLVWRNAAMALTNWRGGYYHYDMAQSWYQKPGMINFFGKVRAGLKSCLNDDVNIQAAVGVITDERVPFRLPDHGDYRLNRTSAYGLYQACSRSGVPYARYLLDDALDPSFKLPKICIMRLPMAMTPAEAKILRDKARRDHSILIWGYGVGKVAQGQPGPQAVCGFTMRALRKLARKPIVVTGKSWAARGLGGQLLGVPPQPINYRLNLRWRGWPYAIQTQPGDVVLGVYPGTNKAGAVMRTRGGLTQIALGRPGAISPQFIRNLAKHVGVMPFSTANDEIYFGSGIMAIYSGRGGQRTITLPKNMTVAGSPTGNSYSATPNGFTFEAGYNSEAIFKIVKRR